MHIPEGVHRIKVSFTKSPPESLMNMNFAFIPRPGDYVETKDFIYRVKGIIHETNETFDHNPNYHVLLEPIDSYQEEET